MCIRDSYNINNNSHIKFLLSYKLINSILSLYIIPASPSHKIISLTSLEELYLFINHPFVSINSISVPKFNAITFPLVFTDFATLLTVYTFFFSLFILIISTLVFALNNPEDSSIAVSYTHLWLKELQKIQIKIIQIQ